MQLYLLGDKRLMRVKRRRAKLRTARNGDLWLRRSQIILPYSCKLTRSREL